MVVGLFPENLVECCGNSNVNQVARQTLCRARILK